MKERISSFDHNHINMTTKALTLLLETNNKQEILFRNSLKPQILNNLKNFEIYEIGNILNYFISYNDIDCSQIFIDLGKHILAKLNSEQKESSILFFETEVNKHNLAKF